MAKQDSGAVNFGNTPDARSRSVNLGATPDQAFEVIPKGVYPFEVVDNEYEISQNGNPMWSISLEVRGGEHDGHKLRTWWTWTERAMPMVKMNAKVLAPELLDMGEFDPEDDDIVQSLIGRRAAAQVQVRRHHEDRDRQVNNVRRILPLAPGTDGSNPFE